MAESHFRKLFEPIMIGQMPVKNRVIFPAMATCYATNDCFVTDQMIRYYEKRAEGGTGLIIVEATCVDNPAGRANPNQLSIDEDKYLPGLHRLAEVVHARGAKIAIQLHHAGPNIQPNIGAHPVAPSPVPLLHMSHLIPRELKKEEIQEIVRKFARGAARAKRAGYDAVDILCAHGYLLNRFLSPHANRRDDGYGGNLDGRVRILHEILDAVKAEVGKDFPILLRIPCEDYVEGGITLEEGIALCQRMEASGVSALTVTGGSGEGKLTHIGPMGYPQGYQVHLAERVKQKVRIPVVAISKIKQPEFAEQILMEGRADMISMGRALIADPEIVLKSERNEVDRIIPCISCNHCLDRIIDGGKPLRCSVNPLAGREYEVRVVPTARPRKILVVGGGPAGMEAAIVAASRGHHVALVEKGDRLGGQLLLASTPPDKDEINPFTNYLGRQLQERGVDVRLKTQADREIMEGIHPEVVIAALGALPLIPSFPGVDLNHVVSAWDALMDPGKIAKAVAIIGGGMVGCDVACFLSSHGKKVTIVEQLDDVGLDSGPSLRRFEVVRLQKAGATIMTKTRAKEITKEGVLIEENGKRKVLLANTVVLSVGARSNREFLRVLESLRVEVLAIGDCVAPRRIVQAISQGYQAGCWV